MRILLVLLLIAFLDQCDQVVRSDYKSFSEAKDNDLFVRGWLPETHFPKSARDIRVNNDLDANISWGEFYFDTNEYSFFVSQLEPHVEVKSSPLRGWAEKVRSKLKEGFMILEHKDPSSTWVFFCKEQMGYCQYSMWTK